MAPRNWPFHGDSPAARARKMCLAYRALAEEQQRTLDAIRALLSNTSPSWRRSALELLENKPASTPDSLDQRFFDWGQEWHCTRVITYQDDDMITAKEAIELISLGHPAAMSRLRLEGRIKGVWDPDLGTRGGYRYKVADVYKLSTQVRFRRPKDSTVNINDNGTGDTK